MKLLSSLIVSLRDQVSGPARGVAASIRGITAAVAANNMAIGRMRGSVVEAAAAGFALYKGLSAPLGAAAKFESALVDIRQKAGLTGQQTEELGEKFRKLGPLVNLTAGEVASGADVLMGMGLDPKRTLELLEPIGRVTTAYRAATDDVAKMTFAMVDNLKVATADVPRVLDVVAQSGKEGAFELKDMAKHFPGLTAHMASMGQTGVLAAARLGAFLQVSRKTAGSSDEAANNLRNLFAKMYSDDVAKDFQKKFGVNIKKELAAAENPVEHFVKRIYGLVGGSKEGITELLNDQQAMLAVLALIQNPDEIDRITATSLKASGVVAEDYRIHMESLQAQFKAFKVSIDNLGISIGNALMKSAKQALGVLTPLAARADAFAKANPKLIDTLAKISAGLVAFKIGAVAAAYGALQIKGVLLSLAKPLASVTLLFGRVLTGAFLGVLRPMALVTVALKVLRGALLLTGIGALLVGIGVAGKFIEDNWSGLGTFFEKFGESFKKGIGGENATAFESFIATMERVGRWMTGDSFKIENGKWAAWGEGAGSAAAKMAIKIVDAMDRIIAGIEGVGDAWKKFMYAVSGDAQYLTPVKGNGKQQSWQGEGDSLPPGLAGRQQEWQGEGDSRRPPPPVDPYAEHRRLRKEWGYKTLLSDDREQQPASGASAGAGWVSQFKASIDAYVERRNRWADEMDQRFTAAMKSADQAISPFPPALIGRPAGGMSLPVGDAAEQLNGTVGPTADVSGVTALRRALAEAKKDLKELNSMSVAPGGIGGLRAGGAVGRAVNGEHSDAGMW